MKVSIHPLKVRSVTSVRSLNGSFVLDVNQVSCVTKCMPLTAVKLKIEFSACSPRNEKERKTLTQSPFIALVNSI